MLHAPFKLGLPVFHFQGTAVSIIVTTPVRQQTGRWKFDRSRYAFFKVINPAHSVLKRKPCRRGAACAKSGANILRMAVYAMNACCIYLTGEEAIVRCIYGADERQIELSAMRMVVDAEIPINPLFICFSWSCRTVFHPNCRGYNTCLCLSAYPSVNPQAD